MGHLSARDGYRRLADRLNRFPQGAPLSERLFRILEILFSPREAQLVAQLPIKYTGFRWRLPGPQPCAPSPSGARPLRYLDWLPISTSTAAPS